MSNSGLILKNLGNFGLSELELLNSRKFVRKWLLLSKKSKMGKRSLILGRYEIIYPYGLFLI